ncbi:MAG: type II secretion system protein GspD [Limisphaerales bacterium]
MKTSRKSKIAANGFVLCVAIALLGVIPLGQAQVVNQAVQTSAITPNQQQVEIGPVLDVIPYVLSDGYTLNLTLIPSLTEFNGYETPPAIPGVNVANVVEVPTILPDFTVRQVVTTVNIWDNQTVVLGGLISSQIQNEKDTVPVLGDLPLMGRLFQSQSKISVKKNLMIFVTATIVDPAGNRVHSDDELPFLQNTIPPQQPGVEVRPGNAGVMSVPAR